MITSRSTSTSTSTRLPWEGSPRPSKPPSVTPSEGTSPTEVPAGIQSTATPSEGFSKSEGQSETRNSSTMGNTLR